MHVSQQVDKHVLYEKIASQMREFHDEQKNYCGWYYIYIISNKAITRF